MLSSFGQQKTVGLVLNAAYDIPNYILIPGSAMGEPTVDGCYVWSLTVILKDVRRWRFMTFSNDDTLDKLRPMFSPDFVTNGSCDHKHDFLVAILTVRRCGEAYNISGADFVKQHFITGS